MLVRRGDLAGADAEYRRAIEMLAIDPVRQHTFRSEWLLNCHADRRDEALREVDVALAVDPTYGTHMPWDGWRKGRRLLSDRACRRSTRSAEGPM